MSKGVDKLIHDPGAFFGDVYNAVIGAITSPKFWIQAAVTGGLAVITGGQSLWVQAIVLGSGTVATGEGYDFVDTGCDIDKFFSMKGVDNFGEYLGQVLFEDALATGITFSGLKLNDYVKSLKGASGSKSPATGKGGFNGNVGDGSGFGKLEDITINVTEKGLSKIKNHIKSNGFDAPENTAMIERIEKAMKNGEKISQADASFYMHELKESTLMSKGMLYEEAHAAALATYEVSPFSVYHPDIITQNPSSWGKPWFDFWGIKK